MSAPRSRPVESGLASLEEALRKKVPPQNLEAESSVLGALLTRPTMLDSLLSELRSVDFYSPVHRLILAAASNLWQRGKPVDLVTVAEELRSQGELEKIGGPAYLASLTEAAPIALANAKNHAAIVRAMAKRRAMVDMGMRMLDIAYDPEREPAEFLNYAQMASDAVLRDRLDTAGETPAEFLNDYFGYLEKLGETGGGAISTPWRRLNEIITGFFPGEVAIVAGRPGNGKTALALNLADHAVGNGAKVGLFSLEMGKYLLCNRLFASGANVRARGFRDGRFTDDEWNKLYAYAEYFKNLPFYIYDKPANRPTDIRTACRRWKRESGLDLIIIDYLQLVPPEHRQFRNREQELAEISRSIKETAKELNIPIVLLAQLNRDVEKRTNKKPLMSDLRESGAIEQDADIIIFIEPWTASTDNVETNLIVAKGRNTGTGTVPIWYRKNYVRFEEG